MNTHAKRQYQFPNGGILQFAKAPVVGKVKTRLIKNIGAEAACQLHKELMSATSKMISESAIAPFELWVAGTKSEDFMKEGSQQFDGQCFTQRGANLGERMSFALKSALYRWNYAVIVGSDCPAMDDKYLVNALTQLEQGAELVVGPAEDGGYVLIGAREHFPSLFEGISWGTERVMQQTREKALLLGIQLIELPTLWDVDNVGDLKRMSNPNYATTA